MHSLTIFNIAAVPVAAGLAATGLGFLFLWPKSAREAASRFVCTLLVCAVAGPCLAIAAYCWWPALFASAGQAAAMAGGPAELGVLPAAPFLVVAGLPAWWLLGALILWFDRRRSKDIGEIAHDAAAVVRSVRETL
jgi:hypothetical protein